MAAARAGAEGAGEQAQVGPVSHRQILRTLSGLYVGLLVSILSSTIVTNALPTIVTSMHAGQSAYTWIISATLLATAATSPIWGKLADLVSKKLLIQISLVIFVAGSALSGFAPSAGLLIAARALQGIGAGGLNTLTVVIMGTILSPRQRGRYSGYLGAVIAVGTSSGPLIGGFIDDTSWLGWRWCFFVVVPVAVAAIVVLQKNLDLPARKRKVTVDWAGAALITSATALVLIWVTIVGTEFAWMSWQTEVMVGGGLLLALLFILAETRAAEPIVPLRLFRYRTVALAVVSSLLVGVALYGVSIFLSQYFQLSRDKSPTMAGILCLPQILGMAASSALSGRVVTATGRWKPILVVGGVLVVAGSVALSLLRQPTPYWEIALGMAGIGVGLGMTLQNLVVAVQNQVPLSDLGVATTVVSFVRTLGGTIGVSVLGAVLANRASSYAAAGLGLAGAHGAAVGSSIPDLSTLSGPVRSVVEDAFGHATGDLFVIMAPIALLSLIGTLWIKEVPLRSVSGLQARAPDEAGTSDRADSDRSGSDEPGTSDTASRGPGSVLRPGPRAGDADAASPGDREPAEP